jgi:hypothetical protein
VLRIADVAPPHWIPVNVDIARPSPDTYVRPLPLAPKLADKAGLLAK